MGRGTPRPFLEIFLLVLVVPLSSGLLRRFGVYDSHRMEGAGEVARKVVSAQLLAFVLLAGAAALAGALSSVALLANYFAITALALAIEKAAAYKLLQSLRRRGHDLRNVCVVGGWEKAEDLRRRFQQHPQWGLRLACVATGRPGERQFQAYPSGEVLGTDLETVLASCVVDELLLAIAPQEMPAEAEMMRRGELYGLLVRAIFDQAPGERSTPRVENFLGSASLAVAPAPRSERDLAVKRIFDLCLAAAALAVSAPLFLIVALMIKVSSRGPVFFTQVRAGMNGRRFRLIKFRTMVDGAEALVRHGHRSITQGPVFKDPNDYRITPVGKYLRRFSIDELPQLINVLKGDMSLVGPRPLPVHEAERISGENRRRFSVPPGITCVWQVNGRSDVTYETWMKYDLQYVDQWSLWQDTVLLFQTIPAVFSGRGAY